MQLREPLTPTLSPSDGERESGGALAKGSLQGAGAPLEDTTQIVREGAVIPAVLARKQSHRPEPAAPSQDARNFVLLSPDNRQIAKRTKPLPKNVEHTRLHSPTLQNNEAVRSLPPGAINQ